MIDLPWRWRAVPLVDLANGVSGAAVGSRLVVVGVDGHSSSGKSTLAPRLAAALPDAAVLHTDDLAWHHGVLAWDSLLRDEVLPRVRSGAPLSYRPPGWVARAREGSVTLPARLQYLVVEGVGAIQPSLREDLDVAIWVETDEPTRMARDALRLAAGEMPPDDYAAWMAEENAYTTAQQPWRHADVVVSGGTFGGRQPDEVLVAEHDGRA